MIRHSALPTCHVDDCGNRSCDRCGERLMCTGPEPAITCTAHIECVDCEADNTCRDCATVRRITRAADAAWEAATEPGPYIDPNRRSWADHWAERRAEDRAYGLARLEDREEGLSA